MDAWPGHKGDQWLIGAGPKDCEGGPGSEPLGGAFGIEGSVSDGGLGSAVL